MKRLLVDSGSSIKQNECEKYNIELIPLKILLGEEEYSDGVDLSFEVFYQKLIEEKIFPKTSLPNLGELEELVSAYTQNGDEVVILTISSEISGSFNAISHLFADNAKVKVIDSRLAVGGMRFLVKEINKHRDCSLDEIEKKVKLLIPRVKIMAIPETLEYLMRGGRLSKKDWILGSMLNIKPIITFIEGKVKVLVKKIGLKNAMTFIANAIKDECDPNYGVVASYTYNQKNLDNLVKMTDPQVVNAIEVYDNLDPAIACHWGPNAFGFVFVGKN